MPTQSRGDGTRRFTGVEPRDGVGLPGEAHRGRVGVALGAQQQPGAAAGGQLDGECRRVDRRRLAVDADGQEAVLAVGAALDDERAIGERTDVDQREPRLLVRETVHQGRHVFGEAGAAFLGIEIAHAAMQGRADVARIQAAQHQVDECRHRGRVVGHRVIGEARGRRRAVGPQSRDVARMERKSRESACSG